MARTLVPTTDVDPVKASLTTALSGAQNDLVFTAQRGGTWGNAIRVQYIDPATNDAVLSVDVDGFDITVNLATDGASAPTSTAAEVAAKVLTHPYASRLVSVALASSNDGTGVVTALSFTALTGGEFGVVQPSATASDATNDHYLTDNEGTTLIVAVNGSASSKTVTIHYAALADIPGEAEVVTIAAGVTKLLGPFAPAKFNQNGDGDVYFDPSAADAAFTFRAEKVARAA